ncbi:MAG: DinB family protein [Planctomycetota bacterium]|nr:DinB family protein [Planctomycetaceae bacterium]MDQ3329456.1 DinB family protein [Planctomycetota bacterium]
MSVIRIITGCWEINRQRTLATLDAIGKLPDPQHALGWRPGPGRAHIAWQLMHIGVTEQLFATERLLGQAPEFPELAPRFKGGSTPDDEIPDAATIRHVLESSRQRLLSTVATFSDDDLATVPENFRERGWSLETILHVLNWHEPHHQGQAHLTLNLYKASVGIG